MRIIANCISREAYKYYKTGRTNLNGIGGNEMCSFLLESLSDDKILTYEVLMILFENTYSIEKSYNDGSRLQCTTTTTLI